MNKPQINIDLEEISSFDVYAKEYLSNELLIDGIKCINNTYTHENYNHIEIKKAYFDTMSFDHCSFEKASFVDVIFNGCDISNSNFKGTYFERCEFIGCKGMGMNMSKSILKHITFKQSNLQYAYFESAKLSEVMFDEVNLDEASFSEAQLKSFFTKDSRFINTNFYKTSLDKIDFTKSEFMHPIVSSNPVELKGIILNPIQAVDLMSLFGIKVQND